MVSNEIEALISKNEEKSAKRGTSVFHLSTYNDPALLKKENYTLICRRCSPTFVCTRHAHILFCSSVDSELAKQGKFEILSDRLYSHLSAKASIQINFIIGGTTLGCIIWSLLDPHYSVTFGFEMNHIRM